MVHQERNQDRRIEEVKRRKSGLNIRRLPPDEVSSGILSEVVVSCYRVANRRERTSWRFGEYCVVQCKVSEMYSNLRWEKVKRREERKEDGVRVRVEVGLLGKRRQIEE